MNKDCRMQELLRFIKKELPSCVANIDRLNRGSSINQSVHYLVLSSSTYGKGSYLMARHALRWARTTKTKIPNKGPYGHGKHDPAIVSHKQKPAIVSLRSTSPLVQENLHDEEAVENLHGIECGLDQSDLFLLLPSALP